jgi:hypothetical protein
MRWRLTQEEFGPNIQHIAGVDNAVAGNAQAVYPRQTLMRETMYLKVGIRRMEKYSHLLEKKKQVVSL